MDNFSKGNDLIVRWAFLYEDGSAFPLTNYAYQLCYVSGRGVSVVNDTAAITVSGNILTWRFSGKDQKVNGKYSLILKLYLNGKLVATYNKREAFQLIDGKDAVIGTVELSSFCDSLSLQEIYSRERERLREAAETTRKSNETARQTAETARQTAETTRMTNESARVTAETQRATDFTTAQATRQSTFEASETSRANTFSASESSRANTFTTSESSRATTFSTNEAARQATFDSKESARDSATAIITQEATKLTNLESEVSDLERKVGDVGEDSSMAATSRNLATTYTVMGEVGEHFTYGTSTYYKKSDALDVPFSAKSVKIESYVYASNPPYIGVFTDDDGIILGKVANPNESTASADTFVEAEANVPKGATTLYINCNGRSATGTLKATYTKYKAVAEEAEKANEKGDFLMEIANEQGENMMMGAPNYAYINSSSLWKSGSNSYPYYCYRFAVNAGDRFFILTSNNPDTAVGFRYAWLKSNDTAEANSTAQFCTGCSLTTIAKLNEKVNLVAPDDAAFLYIYCSIVDATYGYACIPQKVLKIGGDKSEINWSVGMFRAMGIIGHSRDDGSIYMTKTSATHKQRKDLSWSANLCRRNGITYHNFAYYGTWTKEWLQRADCKDAMLAEEACDLYYLGLGSNDTQKGTDPTTGEVNPTAYLGTIADIHDGNPDANADTFYGNYGRIVELVKGHAPNAKIVFAMTRLTQGGNYPEIRQSYFEAVKAIASHYGCPFIDWSEDEWYTRTRRLEWGYSKHPTAIMHTGISYAFERLFSKCVEKNYDYFADYYNGSIIPQGGGSVEVVNNLTSTSATSALSANQGRVLASQIGNINTILTRQAWQRIGEEGVRALFADFV